MYTAEDKDILVEFAELSRKYPDRDAGEMWLDAGGRDDAYRYMGCTWCHKEFPYDELSHADAEKAANEHALTCEKDPRTAELARLRAVEQALDDLFQACSNLCLEDMDKLEKEINAASAALSRKE